MAKSKNKNKEKKAREKRNKLGARMVVDAARKQAKIENAKFNLNENNIKMPVYCPILGIPLDVREQAKSANSPTVLMDDPKKGYIPSNVQVVSRKAYLEAKGR